MVVMHQVRMSNTQILVDQFDGSCNFMLWKIRMLTHLGYLGLKEILMDEKLLREPTKPET